MYARGTLCTFGLELSDSLRSHCKATHLQQVVRLSGFFDLSCPSRHLAPVTARIFGDDV